MAGDYGVVRGSNLLMRVRTKCNRRSWKNSSVLTKMGKKNLKQVKMIMVVHPGSEDESGPSPENLRRHPGISEGGGRPFPS